MDDRRGEGVMLLLVGWALAAECDPAAVLSALAAQGSREDYLCVSKAEAGKDLLLTELLKDPAGDNGRYTRALVLWLLERTDRPMDPTVVARLSPADRRLLADGIRARRGRASPSPAHASVFANLTWYEPVAGYNDARLRPIDRANLAVVDPAVRPAAPPPEAADAVDDAEVAAPAKARSSFTENCGCAGVGGAGLAAGLLGAVAVLARRRR